MNKKKQLYPLLCHIDYPEVTQHHQEYQAEQWNVPSEMSEKKVFTVFTFYNFDNDKSLKYNKICYDVPLQSENAFVYYTCINSYP